MKMDRSENQDGLGKYALLNLRKVDFSNEKVVEAIKVLEDNGIVEWGKVGESDEFFVMKLKDINTPAGLRGYANKASESDPQWADEVRSMISRSGEYHPHCKYPD